MKTEGAPLYREQANARVFMLFIRSPGPRRRPAVPPMLLMVLSPRLCLVFLPLLLPLISRGDGSEPHARITSATAAKVSTLSKFLPSAAVHYSGMSVRDDARIIRTQPPCGVRTGEFLIHPSQTASAQRCNGRSVKRGSRLLGELHLICGGTLILPLPEISSSATRLFLSPLGSCLYLFMSLQR